MDWMADRIYEFMPTGCIRKLSEELICLWIVKAWSDIPAAMIINSFLKYDITNNLDGSKDNMVYNSTKDNINNSELDFKQLFESESSPILKVFSRRNSFFARLFVIIFNLFVIN